MNVEVAFIVDVHALNVAVGAAATVKVVQFIVPELPLNVPTVCENVVLVNVDDHIFHIPPVIENAPHVKFPLNESVPN